MPFPTLPIAFAKPRSVEPPRRKLRIGIPRVLNQWSTHRFWTAFFGALGIASRDVVWSSVTSEAQQKEYGQGRGVVDCCYPVKCMTGHYGELLDGQKRRIDILFSPKIKSLPSVLGAHVLDSLSCPRVMAGPESARAGFQREGDEFLRHGVVNVSPVLNMAEPSLTARQLFDAFRGVLPGLTEAEVTAATRAGFAALEEFDAAMRRHSLEIVGTALSRAQPVVLALGRPYHMDTGIGHDIESDIQAHGYPVLWGQYLPTDPDLLGWLFGPAIREGRISSPFDISDVWRSSYSANTNELIWGAKYAALLPCIACVIRFSSYECGMDQPTMTPVQAIVEESGTLFFSFGELDSTKAAGSVRIRVETIAHYLSVRGPSVVAAKARRLAPPPVGIAVAPEIMVTSAS